MVRNPIDRLIVQSKTEAARSSQLTDESSENPNLKMNSARAAKMHIIANTDLWRKREVPPQLRPIRLDFLSFIRLPVLLQRVMPGILKVHVKAARDLPVMDSASASTDAYAEVRLKDNSFRSSVCRKSLNPEWKDGLFKFEVAFVHHSTVLSSRWTMRMFRTKFLL